jgi:hypothetical protein
MTSVSYQQTSHVNVMGWSIDDGTPGSGQKLARLSSRDWSIARGKQKILAQGR